MKNIFITGTVVASLFLTAPAFSQTLESTVFQIGETIGVGARAMGMGNAFLAISDDYSATLWNPAGLAQIRYNQFFGSLSHLVSKQEATFQTITTPAEASFTRLNAIGFVFPIPTYRGSLVFAGGYNRVKSFDSHLEFFWTNPLPDGAVYQDWIVHETGGLQNWTFSGAIAMAPDLNVGATLNLWTGRDDYEVSFNESDYLDNYTFNLYQTEDNIITEYTAFNFKLGGLYKLGRHMRLGATIATPMTFTARENWYYDEVEEFDSDSSAEYYDSGSFEYKMASPFAFSAGAALSIANLTVSGDAEYNDWSQVRYKSEPPSEGLSKTEANREIQRSYRATTRLRVGAELTLPFLGSQLRAGYSLDPSPYKDADPKYDRQYISAGASFLLDSQVKLDITWIRGWWQYATTGLSSDVYALDEDVRRDRIVSSIVVKF